MPADSVPFAEAPLVRTRSVNEAEARGARLLTGHRLKADGAGFQARINGVSLGGVSVYYLRYGVPLTVFGAAMQDAVGAIVPLQGSMRVQQGSSVVIAEEKRSAALVSPDKPMLLEWSGDLGFMCFKIEVSALRAFAETVDPDVELAKLIGSEASIIGRTGMTGLLGVASLLELAARRHGFGGSGFQHAALSARLCEQAMTTLLIAHPTLWGESSSAPPVQSRRAVHRALEYLESTRGARTTPTELAAAVGVSLRTLELGFRHELDTTPQAHVTDLRLRRAHAELVSSTEEHGATVRAIAARWGFSNAGRFAQQYLAAYGERPSETLRRR